MLWWDWKWLRTQEVRVRRSVSRSGTLKKCLEHPPRFQQEQHLSSKNTSVGQNLSYGWVSHWFTAPRLPLQISFQKHTHKKKKQGREKDRVKEWHSWHYSTWFRETSTCLAFVNVITMMRWWAIPLFSLLLFVWLCVCVSQSYTRVWVLYRVASELAYLSCLCVGIVSGLSGHCIPDMWYIHCWVSHSYQHLLSTSAVSERSD